MVILIKKHYTPLVEEKEVKGIRSFIATNVASVQTHSNSLLGASLKSAWDYGGTDIDLLAVGITFKQQIDSWNSSRVQVQQRDALYRNLVTEYDSAFGTQRVLLSRWIPQYELMGISSRRIKVIPLKNRSFRYTNVAQTGDSIKGMILSEYTVELKNEEGMCRTSTNSL